VGKQDVSGENWDELAANIFIRIGTVHSGGDCRDAREAFWQGA
jgi:hypothetical protein